MQIAKSFLEVEKESCQPPEAQGDEAPAISPLVIYVAPTKALRNDVAKEVVGFLGERGTLLLGSLRDEEEDPLSKFIVASLEETFNDRATAKVRVETDISHLSSQGPWTAESRAAFRAKLAEHHHLCFELYCLQWSELGHSWASGVKLIFMTKTAFLKSRAQKRDGMDKIMKRRKVLLLADELQNWEGRDLHAALGHVAYGVCVGDAEQNMRHSERISQYNLTNGFPSLLWRGCKVGLNPPTNIYKHVWYVGDRRGVGEAPRLSETMIWRGDLARVSSHVVCRL